MKPDIKTVNADTISRILKNGRPAGLWMACEDPKKMQWTGVDSRPGHVAVRHRGTFESVITWLLAHAGVIHNPDRIPVCNQSESPFVGWVVNADGVFRLYDVAEAEIYSGFAGSDQITAKDTTFSLEHRLTEYQREVLRLARKGFTISEIAKAMSRTPKAIRSVVDKLREKRVLPPASYGRKSLV